VRRRPTSLHSAFITLSGWLFAELAVVLMIIALGSVSSAAPPPPPCPPPPVPDGLLLQTVEFVIFVEPAGDGADTVAQFNRQLDEVVGRDHTVGLALLFGVSRDSDPLHGTAVSNRLRELVQGQPGLSQAVDIRPYLGGHRDGEPGQVKVELFLLNKPR
jgi:hypothetical protein